MQVILQSFPAGAVSGVGITGYGEGSDEGEAIGGLGSFHGFVEQAVVFHLLASTL